MPGKRTVLGVIVNWYYPPSAFAVALANDPSLDSSFGTYKGSEAPVVTCNDLNTTRKLSTPTLFYNFSATESVQSFM